MATADAAQLRAVIAALRPDDRRTVVAIRAEPRWQGPDVLDGTPPIRVVPVASPLAAREAVLRHEDRNDGELLVLLTQCGAADLGLDLRAQLVKGDLQSLDPFSSVLALFRAKVLDPALAEQRWLIEELIAIAPPSGWRERAPLGGVLTIDTAWTSWQSARLGLDDTPASVVDVIAAVEHPDTRRAVCSLGDLRERLVERWAPAHRTATEAILRHVADSSTSPGALGIVVDVLWATTDDSQLAQRQALGKARLEPLLGRDLLSTPDARAWGNASFEWLRRVDDSSGVVAEAERLLAEIDGRELAELSDVLPLGFDRRLDRLGTQLATNELIGATEALTSVEQHGLAPRRERQIAACRAAVRLLRRSTSPTGSSGNTLADQAVRYRADLAWLEQARRDLTAGAQSEALAGAFTGLLEEAAEVRRQADKSFAESLATWSSSVPTTDARIVPVEELLERVVAPVAKAAPVLLVVCDGMGLSVSHQLINDLRAEGWAPVAPLEADPWPVGVAALPTVTDASRTSLLAGRLVAGGQAVERAGFSSHAALRRVSKSDLPPVLFHKGGLVAPNGAALPDPVRAAVADPDQRIVGVVVNSVDDHLARGDQINLGWDLASLGPLSWLLSAAAEAGRVVVLTADHGHVLDHGESISRPQPARGGERWRTADSPPTEGELTFSGPRVLHGDGEVVMPYDDRLRFGPPKHGYHGGATAEEVLVPVEVLARQAPDGWVFHPVVPPDWWEDRQQPTERVEPVATPEPSRAGRGTRTQPATPTLFDLDEQQAPQPVVDGRTTWVDTLLASESFAAHRGNVRLPRPLPDDRLRTYLDAIEANGNTITLAALATASGEPMGTLRMTLSVVQRLLNIDGAEILAVRDDGSVVCNVDLLALQFDVEIEESAS